MAHPARKQYVIPLYKRLRDQVQVQISMDEKSEGCWANSLRAWKMAEPDCTHHLVLADDVIVCEDFVKSLETALSYVPRDLAVSPVCGFGKQQVALDRGFAWVIIYSGIWGPAICLPNQMIGPYLVWSQLNKPAFQKHHLGLTWDDYWLCLYLIMIDKRDVWCTAPSLVQHVGQGESLLGHGGVFRSRVFIGENVSGLIVDWSTGSMRGGSLHSPGELKEWDLKL